MIIHLLWVVFMILGLPMGLILRSPVIRWLHFLGMAATAFFAAVNMYCPLTTLEESLRWKADSGFSYEGSFLATHLAPVLYPDISPAILRGASVVWFLLTVIAMVVWRPTSRHEVLN